MLVRAFQGYSTTLTFIPRLLRDEKKNWNYSAGSTFSFLQNFWFFRWESTLAEIRRFRGDELARTTFQQFSHWAPCLCQLFPPKTCDFFFPTRWLAWWTSIFFWESINRITHCVASLPSRSLAGADIYVYTCRSCSTTWCRLLWISNRCSLSSSSDSKQIIVVCKRRNENAAARLHRSRAA